MEPPKNATVSAAGAPLWAAAVVVRTFARVAVNIPMYPAVPEARAPTKNATVVFQPRSETKIPAPTTTTKIAEGIFAPHEHQSAFVNFLSDFRHFRYPPNRQAPSDKPATPPKTDDTQNHWNQSNRNITNPSQVGNSLRNTPSGPIRCNSNNTMYIGAFSVHNYSLRLKAPCRRRHCLRRAVKTRHSQLQVGSAGRAQSL